VLLANAEIEHVGIEYVMQLERQAGRQPEDVHKQGFPYDVSSPPRKIEVKAFGGSARGAPIPLENSQVKAAREDPEHFYVYVVDNIAVAVPALISAGSILWSVWAHYKQVKVPENTIVKPMNMMPTTAAVAVKEGTLK
jgi:hypothetical protein